ILLVAPIAPGDRTIERRLPDQRGHRLIPLGHALNLDAAREPHRSIIDASVVLAVLSQRQTRHPQIDFHFDRHVAIVSRFRTPRRPSSFRHDGQYSVPETVGGSCSPGLILKATAFCGIIRNAFARTAETSAQRVPFPPRDSCRTI